jgi:hypothetical protein
MAGRCSVWGPRAGRPGSGRWLHPDLGPRALASGGGGALGLLAELKGAVRRVGWARTALRAQQPPTSPGAAGHMRRGRRLKILSGPALAGCAPANPGQRCPDIPGGRPANPAREETREGVRGGCEPGSSQVRGRSAALRAATRPGGDLGLNGAVRGGRPAAGFRGVAPPGNTASHRRGPKGSSIGRRRVATGANHPASQSSALRRGPGTPAGAPTGDQSTGLNATTIPPTMHQTRNTSGPRALALRRC